MYSTNLEEIRLQVIKKFLNLKEKNENIICVKYAMYISLLIKSICANVVKINSVPLFQ